MSAALRTEAAVAASIVPPPARNAEARIEAANRWIIEARPIIRAMFALDDARADLITARANARGHRKWSEPMRSAERTYDEAEGHVREAYDELHGMLDGIRSNYVCDETIAYPAADQEAADDINDRVEDETISVKRAIEMAVAEFNAGAFK